LQPSKSATDQPLNNIGAQHLRSLGRRRRPENSILQKTNNSIKDLVGNKENEYPVPDQNRTMLFMTNKLSDIHKKISQRGNYE
jgi:hypothetical protein